MTPAPPTPQPREGEGEEPQPAALVNLVNAGLAMPAEKLLMTNSQLKFTFGGQNHEFPKYGVFNTFN